MASPRTTLDSQKWETTFFYSATSVASSLTQKSFIFGVRLAEFHVLSNLKEYAGWFRVTYYISEDTNPLFINNYSLSSFVQHFGSVQASRRTDNEGLYETQHLRKQTCCSLSGEINMASHTLLDEYKSKILINLNKIKYITNTISNYIIKYI